MFGSGRLYEVRKKSGKVGTRKELPISRRSEVEVVETDNHI